MITKLFFKSLFLATEESFLKILQFFPTRGVAEEGVVEEVVAEGARAVAR